MRAVGLVGVYYPGTLVNPLCYTVGMKVVILYRPESEHARSVETFVHDFQRRNSSITVELVNIDEREGIALIELYDLTSWPAILALSSDGSLLNRWQGAELPLMDEVASYAYSGHQ